MQCDVLSGDGGAENKQYKRVTLKYYYNIHSKTDFEIKLKKKRARLKAISTVTVSVTPHRNNCCQQKYYPEYQSKCHHPIIGLAFFLKLI